MKTTFMYLLLVLSFFFSLGLHAEVSISEENEHGLSLQLEVPSPELKTVQLAGRPFVDYALEGFSRMEQPGFPMVPFLQVHVLLPSNSEPRVVSSNRIDAPVTRLAHRMAYDSREKIHSHADGEVPVHPLAYTKTYGSIPVQIEEVGFAANEKIMRLRIWPIRYDARTSRVLRIKKMDIRVEFVPIEKAKPPVGGLPANIAKYIVLNNAHLSEFVPDNNRVDLVIAHVTHQQTLKRYLDFKKALGRQVREYYLSSTTTTQVKQILVQEYQKPVPPNNTLIVGSMSQIPGFYESDQGSYSDFRYQLLDSGEIPDLALGRVPATNAEELNRFIDKAIQREKGPRDVGQVLLTAGRDTGMGCPQNVTKVGGKIKAAGSDVVITQKYMTQVNSEAVYVAYNNNPNIVVYDGHGDHTGMLEIPLVISNLSRLNNVVHPIILDIACLNANWNSSATRRNFAEMILLQQQAGASGIMASGGSGYGHDFFQTIGSIMAQARLNLSNDTAMNEIGRIILVAKIKHSHEDRSFWNYYGDPASSVWEPTQRVAF